MRLQTGWIDVPMGGKTCAAYRARPAAPDGPLPAVLLVQEIWGVNEFIRDVTERFATAGYLALAPELYSVGERPADLAPERIDAAKRLMDTMAPAGWGDPDRRARAGHRDAGGAVHAPRSRYAGPRATRRCAGAAERRRVRRAHRHRGMVHGRHVCRVAGVS